MTAPQSRVGVAFPVGATHPTPDVETWLDERTEQELQPPCESVYGDTNLPACDNPAAWAFRYHCTAKGCAHKCIRLCCNKCFPAWMRSLTSGRERMVLHGHAPAVYALDGIEPLR